MTIHVNRREVEQQFQELFSQVLKGEEIIITSDGEEMARLVPLNNAHQILESTKSNTCNLRIPGIDKGRFIVPDDFDDPLPEDIQIAFEGES
jgi:antitoxin (DNA-binding transcriptional repressor) of toxin-antitoxin stability system